MIVDGAATADEVAALRAAATRDWGAALGAVIEATAAPFFTDVYDLASPLGAFAAGATALLGDAAHAITPHLGKGSNLAIQDAYALAVAAARARDARDALARFSRARARECGDTLLYSRWLGRFRNGSLGARAAHAGHYEDALANSGFATRMLPDHPAFAPVWRFVDAQVPAAARGPCLARYGAC